MSDKSKFTLADRLSHGLLTLGELAELSGLSLRKIQKDVAAGHLTVEKIGRSARVRGPNAKAYLAGQRASANAA